jgi:preprotein translocase subunit YajC
MAGLVQTDRIVVVFFSAIRQTTKKKKKTKRTKTKTKKSDEVL